MITRTLVAVSLLKESTLSKRHREEMAWQEAVRMKGLTQQRTTARQGQCKIMERIADILDAIQI